MSTSPYTFYQQILDRNSFRLVEILSEKKQSAVFVVTEKDSSVRRILKVNKLFPRKLRRETDFIQSGSSQPLKVLHLPDVLASGENWVLMERLNLVNYTRDTILEKNWSDQ